MAQFFTIYKTTNKINGKIYIGMHETDDPNDDYLGSGKRIKRSIRYYGKEHFEKKVLYIFDNRQEMINKEIELVTEEFINRKDTYNLMEGGHGGRQSDEKFLKFVTAGGNATAFKFKNNPEYRKYVSEIYSDTMKKTHSEGKIKYDTFKGKTHSEETKAKMRKSKNKGSSNSQFGTMWITNEVENKKIKKEDPIPHGWRKGRLT